MTYIKDLTTYLKLGKYSYRHEFFFIKHIVKIIERLCLVNLSLSIFVKYTFYIFKIKITWP